MRAINLYIKCSTAAPIVAIGGSWSPQTLTGGKGINKHFQDKVDRGDIKSDPDAQRYAANRRAHLWNERAKNFINGVRDERNPTQAQRQQAETLLNETHSFAGKVGGQTAQEFRRLQTNLTWFKDGGHFENGNIVLPRREDGQRARPRTRSLGHNPRGAPEAHRRHASADRAGHVRDPDAASRRASFARSRHSSSQEGFSTPSASPSSSRRSSVSEN